MTQLHQQIYRDFLEKVGADETEFGRTHGAMRELDYPGFCRYMFQNWTSLQPSFKLTNIGFVILSRMYQTWQFTLANQPANLFNTARAQLFLTRYVKSPYHYDRSHFHLFHSERAMELTMAEGDISQWIEMFS